jgi:hypothetical protein
MMTSIADIEILILVMAWTVLNHSLIQDWIAGRGQDQGVKV